MECYQARTSTDFLLFSVLICVHPCSIRSLALKCRVARQDDSLLIDGGICNPAIIAQVIPTDQIVCLSMPERPSSEIWQESDDRKSMKEAIYQLPNPGEAWRKFLEFDGRITGTILKECQENHISTCTRGPTKKAAVFAQRVAGILGI